jgi:hypothetical protein
MAARGWYSRVSYFHQGAHRPWRGDTRLVTHLLSTHSTPSFIVSSTNQGVLGGPFTIDRIPNEDLKNGTWDASWLPKVEHPSIPPEFVDAFSKKMVGGISLAIGAGCFDVGDEWNRLLPDFEFTDAKDFLRKAWGDKN